MTTKTVPAEAFPVIWDDPKDAELCWRFGIARTPDDVMTPLGFDLFFGPFIGGFGWARICQQNYFVYDWFDHGAIAEAAGRFDLAQLKASAKHFWDEVVPEVEGYTQRFLGTDFDALSDDELVTEIEKLPALRTRMGLLHEEAWLPYDAGMRRLIDTYEELVGDDELAAVRLVQGYGNRSVAAGRALWQLSRLAASTPAVRQHIVSADRTMAGECMAALQREPQARGFLDAFASFLNEYGWRRGDLEFAMPTWAEDPRIPLCQLRAYLEMPDYDPDAEQLRIAAEREEAIAETLSGLSLEDAERMRATIDAARQVVSLQEDHNFYIDQRCAFSPRRLVLAAARRLVSQGALADENDVFYLRSGELLAALRGENRDAASIAERTKSEMQRWSATPPPQTIGAPPPVDESLPAPLGGHGAQELRGNGASAGVARGPARVLMSLAEADRLRPGDVLVARTTTPAWTPLFAVACAVVTETGGVLSHAAVVAREYRIPAVLNAVDATRLIRDGQLVEVDGSRSIIRVIS